MRWLSYYRLCCRCECQTSRLNQVSDLWLAVAAVSAGCPAEVPSADTISNQGFIAL